MSPSPAPWPRPGDDAERISALHDLQVLDQPPDAALDCLTRVAAHVCGTPRAVVNLLDGYRQWQASAYGAPPVQASRDESMCGFSVLSREVVYTPDASTDPVFHDNPHVTGRLDRIRLYAAAPLVTTGGHVIGTLCAFSPEPGELEPVQVARLRDLARVVMQLLETRRTAGLLAKAAVLDPLTGLPNRAMLAETVDRALARRDRAITSPSLLFIDLDGFKAINDRYGHATGDSVLREVARRLRDAVRATDLVARYGGDEFVVLVEESAADHGSDRLDGTGAVEELAERVRQRLTFVTETMEGEQLPITASVGVAHADGPSDTTVGLLSRADAQMYSHKRTSRSDGSPVS